MKMKTLSTKKFLLLAATVSSLFQGKVLGMPTNEGVSLNEGEAKKNKPTIHEWAITIYPHGCDDDFESYDVDTHDVWTCYNATGYGFTSKFAQVMPVTLYKEFNCTTNDHQRTVIKAKTDLCYTEDFNSLHIG